MAAYLWKEVSTNIDLHASEGTKRWKNRSVFNFSNTTNMLQVRQGYSQIRAQRNSGEHHRQLSRAPSAETWPPALTGCDVAVSNNLTKDAQVERFKTHLKYLLLWQHFESTQTQQQNSRMWFKMKPYGGENHLLGCSVLFTFVSTLLLGTKMKRWDTQHQHTRLKLGGTCFLLNSCVSSSLCWFKLCLSSNLSCGCSCSCGC